MNTLATQHPALADPALIAPARSHRIGRGGGEGGEGGEGFSSLLTQASSAQIDAGKTKADKLRETVEQFVASAFLSPLFAELREQPLDSDLFGGGLAEDSFQQQLDTILADRIASGPNFPVVDAVYRRIAANTPGLSPPAPESSPRPKLDTAA